MFSFNRFHAPKMPIYYCCYSHGYNYRLPRMYYFRQIYPNVNEFHYICTHFIHTESS